MATIVLALLLMVGVAFLVTLALITLEVKTKTLSPLATGIKALVGLILLGSIISLLIVS